MVTTQDSILMLHYKVVQLKFMLLTNFTPINLIKSAYGNLKGHCSEEKGAIDHIKVQVKNNGLELGAPINNEDNWFAHQNDFNQLLAELNSCYGPESAISP